MLDVREEILKTLRATPVVLIIEVVAHMADTEEQALGMTSPPPRQGLLRHCSPQGVSAATPDR
jgi:hypothetical protein